MNEMVDRLARAICDAEACQGLREPFPCDVCDKGGCVTLARAAIGAMREPTEAMIDAIADALMDGHDEPTTGDCALIWRAGIDAALGQR